jgi:hydrogenase expression/formation protein HypC
VRIVEVKDRDKAVVDMGGTMQEISTILLPKRAEVGDWVMVHIGYAIEKIDVEAAEEMLRNLSILFQEAEEKRT